MVYAQSRNLPNYNKRGGAPKGCVLFRTTYDAASNEISEDKVDIRTLTDDDLCRTLPRKADIVTVLYYRSENDTRYAFEGADSPEDPLAAAACAKTSGSFYTVSRIFWVYYTIWSRIAPKIY